MSERTRQKVLDAANALSYVPNASARRMAGGRSHVLGVFTYERVFPSQPTNFFHAFLVGVTNAAEDADCSILLASGSKVAGRRSLYAQGSNVLSLADAGVLLGSRGHPDEIQRLVAENYPFVYIGERHFPDFAVSYVAADYREGTASAVAAAYARGHRRLAYLRSHADLAPGRTEGFVLGCRRMAIPENDFTVIDCESMLTLRPGERSERVVDALLDWQPSVVFNQGGLPIEQIWPRLLARGVRIPGELSIVDLHGNDRVIDGFALTELAVPRVAMGQRAAELARTLIDEPHQIVQEVLPCGFRAGDTLITTG